MGVSSITVVGNSLRLRRFGRPGRRTPVRSRRERFASIAAIAVVPVVALGALVLAVPDTFAVPASSSQTLTEPAGETLQVYTQSLRPGTVLVHLQLNGATGDATVKIATIALKATSNRGATRTGQIVRFGPSHWGAYVDLTVGVWKVTLNGTDGSHRHLGGSVTLPIN
jgi:hypothetical protein